MFFQKIESKGLAHFSYMMGDGGKAFVVDPRRDIQIYLDLAMKNNLQITHIFETHRNEDYVIGSMELGEKTGAEIYRSAYEDLGYVYGKELSDGDCFEFGSLTVQAIHTPGHTLGHMSYGVYEKDRESCYLVFTGDCLFMNGLGRTDFYGEDQLDKMTGLIYDSVFHKLFPLGEDTLVFPAHGAGSACGDDMEDRPYTTMGYEKKYNKELQVSSKDEFIEKFGKMRIKPRYFDQMEIYNTKGAPFLGGDVSFPALKMDEIDSDWVLLDVRSKESFAGGHIPGSYFLSLNNLSTFLGTLFDSKQAIVLVTDRFDDSYLKEIKVQMGRIGFDNLKGYLQNGVNQFVMNGKALEMGESIEPKELLELEEEFTLIDLRLEGEVPETIQDKTERIPLQVFYKNLEKIDKDKPVYILCQSGERAATGYSYLKNKGYDVAFVKGGAFALNKE